MKHVLKIEDQHYENIRLGRKTFEVRFNDRDYQVGDELQFTDVAVTHTRPATYKVVYVHGSGYGMKSCFVVLGIERKE